MALIWMDGFDLYTAKADMLARYSTVTDGFTTGRFSGQCLRNSSSLTPQTWSVTSGNTFSIGFAHRISDLSGISGVKTIVQFSGASGATAVCKLGLDINGALTFGRGDYTTNKVCNSSNGVIVANAWNYIEIELTRAASATGAVNVYVNGGLVATASAGNTGAIAIDTISLGTDFISANRDYDDLYVVDVATKLGECRIDTLRPSVDTAQKDFTASTGTSNFAMVDDPTFNSDTDYIMGATAGNFDLYDVADLGFTPATVFAVQTVLAARKDDAVTRQVRSKLKSSTTVGNGATRNPGTTYGYATDLFVTNPATATAWTASTVNAMQLGVEVVT